MFNINQLFWRLYAKYPNATLGIPYYGAIASIFLGGIVLAGVALSYFGLSLWFLLALAPLVVIMIALTMVKSCMALVKRFRHGAKPGHSFNQILSPITRVAISPVKGFNRRSLDTVLKLGTDINDTDDQGRTLLDHMLLPMYANVFRAEDVEYVISLGARVPDDFLARLREVDNDEAHQLALKLHVEARLPELQAIAVANRGDLDEEAPPRRRL